MQITEIQADRPFGMGIQQKSDASGTFADMVNDAYAAENGPADKASSGMPIDTVQLFNDWINKAAKPADLAEKSLDHQLSSISEKLGVGIEEAYEKLEGLLVRREVEEGLADPKAFLKSLTVEERETLVAAKGMVGGLSDHKIDAMSDEGAYNMIAGQAGFRDFDRDGITEVGQAKILRFPSEHTPPAVTKAWNAALDGKEGQEHSLLSSSFILQMTGPMAAYTNGGVSPAADPGFDYLQFVKDRLSFLESVKNSMKPEYYERSAGFLTKFQQELEKAGVV